MIIGFFVSLDVIFSIQSHNCFSSASIFWSLWSVGGKYMPNQIHNLIFFSPTLNMHNLSLIQTNLVLSSPQARFLIDSLRIGWLAQNTQCSRVKQKGPTSMWSYLSFKYDYQYFKNGSTPLISAPSSPNRNQFRKREGSIPLK